MRRKAYRGLGVIGAVMIVQSVFWEVARMRPDYGFLVSPWAVRGFDTDHGSVLVAIGLALLSAVLLTLWDRSQDTRISLAIVGFIAVAAVVITAIFARRPAVDPTTGFDVVDTEGNLATEVARVTIPFNFLVLLVLALLVAHFVYQFIDAQLQPRIALLQRRGTMVIVRVAVLGASVLVLQVTFSGKSVEVLGWVAMVGVMVVVVALASGSRPRELAANRMLILTSVVAGGALSLSAGAMRSTLIRLQVEETGSAALFKDTQITWGYFLAVIGTVLVFVGAVTMWARRRDFIINLQRARRQRAAAQASAAEIHASVDE